ncbi:MAG TPA: hypothetical protein VMG81_02650 [Thermoplasmata archaeon]|nr:hypothetical protein [Thermoplasmata archaeon]
MPPAVPASDRPAAPVALRVCYLSRKRGWIDPGDPRRPTSEVNVLAVALRSRVWTLDTAWASVFNTPVPRHVASAYRRAMSRASLTDEQVTILREVADRLRVELRVVD